MDGLIYYVAVALAEIFLVGLILVALTTWPLWRHLKRLQRERDENVREILGRWRIQLTSVVLTASVLVVAPANAVEVEFISFSAASQSDVRTYRAIWEESSERIVAAFEAVTCLPFAESIVRALVAERVSNSGGPEHPMQLRASYVRAVKQATLVHELGHRVLWQLTKRLDGVDGHMTLDLVLDRVWAYVWGEKFAEQRIRDESR